MKLPGKFSRKKKKNHQASYLTELTRQWSQSNWSGSPNRHSLILHVVILKVKSVLGVWYIIMWDSNWTRKDHNIRGLKWKGCLSYSGICINTELHLFAWSSSSGCYADHLLYRFIGWVLVLVFILKNMICHTPCLLSISEYISSKIPEMIDIIDKNHE